MNTTTKLEKAIDKFLKWLLEFGFYSYDQFDYWGTNLGVIGKKIFLKNKIIALPIVLPLQIFESFLPGARKLFAKKQRFAIGDAHFALGFMNLYRAYDDKKYLELADTLLNELLKYSTKTENGIGWGYPYVWPTQYRIFQKGEPVITVTPYVFDAFSNMYEITKDEKFKSIIEEITRYVALDINEEAISSEISSSSYGPFDESKVINAVCYRAATLLKAYVIIGDVGLKEKAKKNINFVLSEQRNDGSWLYASDSKFIDNFHTCFVLNKLTESYLILKNDEVLESIKKGYKFYRENFVRSDHTLIHFYKSRFPKFRKIEMYDYAESILLGILLNDIVEGALDFSEYLANFMIENFQLSEGYFITRISNLGKKNKIPYLRWPQAQLFYALTNLLLVKKRNIGNNAYENIH